MICKNREINVSLEFRVTADIFILHGAAALIRLSVVYVWGHVFYIIIILSDKLRLLLKIIFRDKPTWQSWGYWLSVSNKLQTGETIICVVAVVKEFGHASDIYRILVSCF